MDADEWDRRAAEKGITWVTPHLSARHKREARRDACGYEWAVAPGSGAAGTGSQKCAEFGFGPERPALVYQVRHQAGPLMKVGVANNGGVRLDRHGRIGLTTLGTWSVPPALMLIRPLVAQTNP